MASAFKMDHADDMLCMHVTGWRQRAKDPTKSHQPCADIAMAGSANHIVKTVGWNLSGKLAEVCLALLACDRC